jgi:hypothetical protein
MAIRASSLTGPGLIPVGGPPGLPGQSTFAAWLTLPGNGGKSLADFMAAQKGKDGVTQDISGKLDKTGDASGASVKTDGGTPRSFSTRAADVIWAADYGVVADAVVTNGVVTAGTDMTAKAQAAINAAVTAHKDVVFPPGDILLSTTYQSGRTDRGLGPYNLKVQGGSRFRIVGAAKGGTRFVSPPQTAVQLWVNESDNFEIVGIKGYGDNAGMGTGGNGQFSGFLCLYSVRDFRVADVETSAFKGSVIHGNFQFNGAYERVKQVLAANGSSGFDVASWQNIELRRHVVIGSGGGQGFQHIFDAPNNNQAYNLTGITLVGGRSNNVRVTDGDYTKLATPIVLSEIDDVWVERNNIHDNLSASGDFLVGVVAAPSSSTPMRNVNINSNRFSKNGSSSGTAGTSGGLALNSNNGPVYATVQGNKFFDNVDSGIVVYGTNVFLTESGNRYANVDTTSQLYDYSGTPILVQPPSSGMAVRPGGKLLYGAYDAFSGTNYTPTITTGGTLTSAAATGRWIRIGNLVWVRITVAITTNGTGGFPLRATLPFTSLGVAMLQGGETASQGIAEYGEILTSATTVHIKTPGGTYPGADGRVITVSGFYEAAP